MESNTKNNLCKNHEKYLLDLEKQNDIETIGYYLTEHLRVAGAYWTLTALSCLRSKISDGSYLI